MPDLFADIFVASDIETAVETTLRKWFPQYLTALEVKRSLPAGELKVPTNYTQRNSFDGTPGEKLPKVVVISPGMRGSPTMDGSKQYRGTWGVGVGIGVVGSSEDEASDRAKIYGAIARAILIHHPSLGGIAEDTRLVDEQYPDIPIPSQSSHYRAANILLEVDVNVIVRKYGGPKDPPDAYGEVDLVDIEVERV